MDQLSDDIQREMPGLKGFSAQNLKKMRLFYEAWTLSHSIGSAMPNQLSLSGKSGFGSAVPNQIQEHFSNIGFTNHFLIISKTRTAEERLFYIVQASLNNWSSRVLDDKIKLPHENQSVGIILCKEKSDTLVKYAIGGIRKPMGVAIYKTKNDLPEIYRKVLPEPEDLRKLMNAQVNSTSSKSRKNRNELNK